MKNLIAEKPADKIHGRLAFSISFVDSLDIKNKTILDIGCGYGWFELNILSRGVKKIIATEYTQKDLETIKKYIKSSELKFQEANAIDLPFADNTFDTVVSWEVIEHIPINTEKQMFAEVYRVLRPNGVFYLSTPFKSWPSLIFDPAWWLTGHRHYTKEQLSQFGKKSNFKLLKSSIKGQWWEIFGILNLYFSKWILRRRPVFEKIFNKKINGEYKENNGFVDIFVKFQKI